MHRKNNNIERRSFRSPLLDFTVPNRTYPKKYPKDCQPTYYLNAKVTERKDSTHVKTTQKSIGFSSVAFVELTVSASKENLPIFGDGFLDIFVKKIKTEDGYDYWKECPQKK